MCLSNTKVNVLILILIMAVMLIACDVEEPPPTLVPNTPTQPIPTATATAIPATPTPIPLAARVSGEGITLQEFEAELNRFLEVQEAEGLDVGVEAEKIVLDYLIDRHIFAQAAWQAGFLLEDEELQARMGVLVEEVGGEEAMGVWMVTHGYTDVSLIEALRLAISAAWMRDRILEEVPIITEQIHARQIYTTSTDQADQILSRLQAGEDFSNLAAEYDPLLAGYLGWFPRGYLLESELEEAAFNLQPDEYSQVIETRLGFHIVQVIERDPERPLEPDAYLTLQTYALQEWVETRREEIDIEIIISLP